MRANEFVERLKVLAPTVSSLIQRGYSENGAKRIVESYKAKAKSNIPYRLYENELLTLVKDFDATTVEIGFIRFDLENQNDIPLETNELFRVGWVEGDLLVVNKQTGEVQMEDCCSEGFIIAKCAENSEKFLDAILEIAKLNTTYSNSQDNKTVLCSKLAGGEQYEEFYKLLLG
jgi:hypothetical protein